MFTKKKLTGIARGEARQYKKVIDWEAVGGAIFLGVVVWLIISAL